MHLLTKVLSGRFLKILRGNESTHIGILWFKCGIISLEFTDNFVYSDFLDHVTWMKA